MLEESSIAINAIIAPHLMEEGPLLPILHDIQDRYGYIPPSAIPLIAEALNCTRADIHGVVSFYHDFRATRAGTHILRLCRAEACRSMGGKELSAAVMERLGIGWHETTDDGTITLEPVFCLGLCANAPAGMFDAQPLAALDMSDVDGLLDRIGT